MLNFEQLNLDPRIAKALSACGYTTPTAIQSRSIPDILNGKDLVASAQTGTGKTAAFVLPALHRISLTKSNGKPRILILSPTRELATQITDAVTKYSKFLHVNITSLLGGMPYHKQLKALSRSVDIIVATPGRLMDHMERKRIDLSQIEMLILDEADRMLDMGFIDDVNYIANKIPKNRQTLLFSATVDNRIAQVIRTLLTDPIRIDITKEKLTPTQIKQELYYADSPNHKTRLLQHLLANENIFKAIIFSATKANADRLAKELHDMDYPEAPLHGDLKQAMRNRTVEQLRRGKIQFLVATDVAARGIDISDVTHVINFDLPKFSEDYVHRIGRTGRAGKTGIAISFALPSDARHVQRIERYINQKFSPSVIPGLEPKARQKENGNKSNPNKRQRMKNADFVRLRKSGRDGSGTDKNKSPFADKKNKFKPFDRDSRPRSFDRDDKSKSFDRENRPKSFDRKNKSDPFDRDSKPKSFDRKRKADSFGRNDRPNTFDRKKKTNFSSFKKKTFGQRKTREQN